VEKILYIIMKIAIERKRLK